jgi:hypothetical protein
VVAIQADWIHPPQSGSPFLASCLRTHKPGLPDRRVGDGRRVARTAIAPRDPEGLIWHTGTPIAYALLFVIFAVPLIAAATLPWRIDPYGGARPMRQVPDQPAAVDPVIEPGRRIMVCAILAGVDWIDAEFLAKTLRMNDEELSRQTAELVAVQWWFTLTPVGRAAYRRHLRALQRAA